MCDRSIPQDAIRDMRSAQVAYTGDMVIRILLLLVMCCACLGASCVGRRPPAPRDTARGRPATVPAPGSNASFSPRHLAFSDVLLSRLRLPARFRVNVFARGVDGARIIAVGPDGTVYVTQTNLGQVSALWDRDGDGRAEGRRVVATDLPGVHGIAIHAGTLYLAMPTRISSADLHADGTLGQSHILVDNLPSGGGHANRTLGFGPDGLLYVSVGSSCNACVERNPERATLLRMRADGSERHVLARGLRNTEAFDWHPLTRQLWGMDQGADGRGADRPPEELNHIREGRHYGWPWCFGARQVDTLTVGHPSGMTTAQFCATTEPAVLGYQAHSSPIQLKFYTGSQFPAAYRNDAFQTFHGSWNRQPAVGYSVVRIRFDAGGQPTGFENFLTGFLTDNGQAQFGRPAGLAIAADGALLVGDDGNGVIYRIFYR